MSDLDQYTRELATIAYCDDAGVRELAIRHGVDPESPAWWAALAVAGLRPRRLLDETVWATDELWGEADDA